MPPLSVRARFTVPAFLLLVLVTCGDTKEALPAKGALPPPPPSCTCVGASDITIKVNHGSPNNRGVDKKAAYLCEGYKITWVIDSGSNDKSFKVEFVGPDYPFGAVTIFNSSGGTVSTGPLPHFSELTVFKYNITITDNSGNPPQTFDPHVVGGG